MNTSLTGLHLTRHHHKLVRLTVSNCTLTFFVMKLYMATLITLCVNTLSKKVVRYFSFIYHCDWAAFILASDSPREVTALLSHAGSIASLPVVGAAITKSVFSTIGRSNHLA